MAMTWMRGAALLCVASLPLAARATSDDFTTQFELDPEAYQGSWHELARTPNGLQDNHVTIEGVAFGPCEGSRAEYTLESKTRVGVLHRCTRTALDGSGATLEDALDGVGLVVPDGEGRKLKVAFGNALFRIITRVFTLGGADYWVYGVGPRGSDGRYDWALVSDSARGELVVLARERAVPDETLAEILRLAQAEGLPTGALVFDAQR